MRTEKGFSILTSAVLLGGRDMGNREMMDVGKGGGLMHWGTIVT
jgi:hypothetical protein